LVTLVSVATIPVAIGCIFRYQILLADDKIHEKIDGPRKGRINPTTQGI
jgi:hypothetical protein